MAKLYTKKSKDLYFLPYDYLKFPPMCVRICYYKDAMKRKSRLHLRATEGERSMIKELAADLDTSMTKAMIDAVRFAYLHLDLIVAWNKTYKEIE